VEVEVRDRAALAGDVDEVVRAAEQPERARARHLEHVGEHRRLGNMAAADGDRVAVAVETDPVVRAPLGARDGATGRDLAGFGAAIDLEERRAEARLGTRRELRRQRRGRAENERRRRSA